MSDSIQHTIARRVRAMRTSLKMSKVEFALQLGISRQQLDRLESGRSNITLTTLEKIARNMGLEPWELIK